LAEISKIFFSETNELTEPKLKMNDHWNVLYQATVEMPVPSQGHYGFHSFPIVD
jgi:hypothetical protein